MISKLAAGRIKDLEFCDAAVRSGVVELPKLTDRLEVTALSEPLREAIRTRLDH